GGIRRRTYERGAYKKGLLRTVDIDVNTSSLFNIKQLEVSKGMLIVPIKYYLCKYEKEAVQDDSR
ncbi:MAG: hypothetical protein ACFFCW_33000, partial [Candidatus Hodarchaeota archaeon]